MVQGIFGFYCACIVCVKLEENATSAGTVR